MDGVGQVPPGQSGPLLGVDDVVGRGDDPVEGDGGVVAESGERFEAGHDPAHTVDCPVWQPRTRRPSDCGRRSTPTPLDRVLTVPNPITAVRLACVPVFLWLLFGAHRQTDAAILLAVLGATDWVDGFVARRWRQVSTLGKVLDPVADRILVGTAVIAVIVHGAVPLWFGVATLAREVLVSAAVLLLAALGAERIDVLWVGKAGTFGLMVAYPTFLLAHGHGGLAVRPHGLRLAVRHPRPGPGLDRGRLVRARGPSRPGPRA